MTAHHFAQKKTISYCEKLDVFFAGRESQDLGVPRSSVKNGFIANAFISKETGVPVHALEVGRVRQCVIKWVAKIGLGEPVTTDLPKYESNNKRGLLYQYKIDTYLNALKREGRQIPENMERSGKPDLARVSSESGVPVGTLRRASQARLRLREGIAEIGLKIYVNDPTRNSPTFGQLLEAGRALRAEELVDRPNQKQQLYNTESALRRLMRFAGRGLQDPVGAALADDFEETVRKITEQINSSGSRRKFSVEIRRWPNYYRQVLGAFDLPSDFREAFEAAIERAGINTARLSELADVRVGNIVEWVAGRKYPSRSSFLGIERIECVLSLPPKTLISRIKHRQSLRFQLSDYPEYVKVDGEEIAFRNDRSLLAYVRPLLPDDFNQRKTEEREEIVSWIIANLLGATSEWSRANRILSKARYAMNSFPAVVEQEVREVSVFKQSKIPPPGMKRGQSWSANSVQIYRNDFGRIFGALALPRDADDPLLRGLGLDPECFTLAMFTCPNILHWWVEWKGRRRQGYTGQEKYTGYESVLVFMVGGLFQKKVGWLRQRPDLAGHLRPVPGFIDDDFIERANREWDAVCDEAYACYMNLGERIADAAEQVRDPFEPILPILESVKPISALRLFCQNIIDDMPDPSTAPDQAARAMRNYSIARILSATGLRSKNLRELTYSSDNTGKLRKEGDKWVIEISHHEFKNRHSSFFGSRKKKANYRKILPDADRLYERIEEYVRVHRLVLLGSTESDVFFVASASRPMFSTTKFHRCYRHLTARYLAHNPFRQIGIPGVRPHGPHAVRDIIATHVIKATGSYELAAYSIADSVRTIREHYARFMPEDKIHLTDEIINASWATESDEDSDDELRMNKPSDS